MTTARVLRAARRRPRQVNRVALALVAASLLTAAGCGPTSFLITPVPGERALRESVVIRESVWASRKVAIIDVDGMLQNARPQPIVGPAGDNPVSVFKEKLDRAAKDDRVAAIVLRINTPGGGVTASDLMYAEMRRFKRATEKPVVACMLDLGTSGGYYLACAADHIVAHPTTVTGSIGVIMLSPNIAETLAHIGAEVHIFKSGRMKDAGSPFRKMTDADRELFQKLIDGMYARFLAVVAQARPALAKSGKLEQLADGRVFLGGEALDNGLIDQLGTLNDAIIKAKDLAGLADESVLVVQYSRPLAHRPNFYADGSVPGAVSESRATELFDMALPPWLRHSTPQFLYMWAPGW